LACFKILANNFREMFEEKTDSNIVLDKRLAGLNSKTVILRKQRRHRD